jgi:hypothetical protein
MAGQAAAAVVTVQVSVQAPPVIHHDVRCGACRKKLAEWCAAPFCFRCPRCKAELRQE